MCFVCNAVELTLGAVDCYGEVERGWWFLTEENRQFILSMPNMVEIGPFGSRAESLPAYEEVARRELPTP